MKYWQCFPKSVVQGVVRVPGDKSISHRAIMLGALADGVSEVFGFLQGEDCLATLRAFSNMGVRFERLNDCDVRVHGVGLHGLSAPKAPLDLGNSGTSMRLMAGILAGQKFDSVLVGDASLMRRPMERVCKPLRAMGAVIESEEGHAPLRIQGRSLQAIEYDLPVASAQLKSALLLAGLYADGVTRVVESGVSRDHSERMLRGFGVSLVCEGNSIAIQGGQSLKACNIHVPGDVSSAAFFIVAGLIAREGELLIENVGMNPTRAAVVDILKEMGGDIVVENAREVGGEPVADLRVRPSRLQGICINERYVPIAIDEFPILFVAAACAEGETRATGLSELRVKESDRLEAMALGLKALGIVCETGEDWIVIQGRGAHDVVFSSGAVESFDDHRIAMSFAVAALRAEGEVLVRAVDNVATSFPNFKGLAESVGFSMLEKVA